MKPGLGKPHRACAARCISGGIPPVLMMRNHRGEADHLLLVGAGDRRIHIHEEILDHVAEPVEVTGALARQGDWLLLRLDPSSALRPPDGFKRGGQRAAAPLTISILRRHPAHRTRGATNAGLRWFAFPHAGQRNDSQPALLRS